MGQMAQFTTVNVNQCAKITKKLNEVIIKSVGEETELSVETEGLPEPKLTWEIDGMIITGSDKKYELKSEGQKHKLLIKNISRDDCCKIKVKAANEYGKDECSGDVKINRSPKIVQKLKPVVVNLGESAMFEIKADSFPAPKVKWWLGDIEIDSKKYENNEDTGVFKCKIPNVEASGTVKVKVSNDFGSEEDEAALTVKCKEIYDIKHGKLNKLYFHIQMVYTLPGKPIFKKGLKDIQALENESLDIQVEIKGTPEPQVTFFHNGNEVTTDARIKIKKTSSETYHMTFNVLIPSDSGDWECRATNELGEVSSKCKITVEGTPKFEKRLEKTIEVYESEDLQVEVSVSGLPKPVLKW